MKYNNAVAGYNQTNIGLKQTRFGYSFESRVPCLCYNQTNIGLKHINNNIPVFLF